MTIYSAISVGFLSSCGPEEPPRFLENRDINIVDFLPNHLKESEVSDVVTLFQDVLNGLYFEKQYTNSASGYEIANRPKISILEKINRLTELHDPDLVDVEYLQYFANYLGYTVDVNRGELGILQDSSEDSVATRENVKRYLRFVVSNLPNWYRIKTTRNAVKVMLFSFGLIGDLLQYFTSDYRPDNGNNWRLFREDQDGDIHQMPQNFYPTPHFSVLIDLDASQTEISFTESARLNVFKAINSVRPTNTVFEGVTGYVKPAVTVMNYAIYHRSDLTIKIVQ